MLAVVRVFRTSLVAVPALRRVEPASTSAPVAGTTWTWVARGGRKAPSALQATSTGFAPRLLAAVSAALTNGVTPLAEIPTTTSPPRTRARTARRAAARPVIPDDVDPRHRWDRPLHAPGHTQVDFEERVEFRR